MADKEKYMIKVEGKLVEVTPEVYYAYFRMERQERWQEEKKWEHGVVSYDALDNGTTVGAEAMPDPTVPDIEESSRHWQGRKGHWTLQPMVITTSTCGRSGRSLLCCPSASMSIPRNCFIRRTASGLIRSFRSVPAE